MRYLEVAVRCARPASPVVEALLQTLAGGVAIDDPLDIAEARASGRWEYSDLEAGDTSRLVIRAYFPEAGDLTAQQAAIAEGLGGARELGAVDEPVLRWVQEEDWAENWKAYFKPLRFGRLVVAPSWEPFEAQPADVVLRLDPGMAFGTGSHATTALCLGWLAEIVRPGQAVADVGTGSGILAIAAALLGAAPVLGCDIDPVAVQVAAANAAANGVALHVVHGALADCREWLAEHAPSLVVANIIADVIMPLAPDVAALLPAGGAFLASGIIDTRRNDVLLALRNAGLSVAGVREEGGWVAVLARKP